VAFARREEAVRGRKRKPQTRNRKRGFVVSGAIYSSVKIPGTAVFHVHNPERESIHDARQEQAKKENDATSSHQFMVAKTAGG
jgi:hypothetical protein